MFKQLSYLQHEIVKEKKDTVLVFKQLVLSFKIEISFSMSSSTLAITFYLLLFLQKHSS